MSKVIPCSISVQISFVFKKTFNVVKVLKKVKGEETQHNNSNWIMMTSWWVVMTKQIVISSRPNVPLPPLLTILSKHNLQYKQYKYIYYCFLLLLCSFTRACMPSAHLTIGISTILLSNVNAPFPSAWCFAFASRIRCASSMLLCDKNLIKLSFEHVYIF